MLVCVEIRLTSPMLQLLSSPSSQVGSCSVPSSVACRQHLKKPARPAPCDAGGDGNHRVPAMGK